MTWDGAQGPDRNVALGHRAVLVTHPRADRPAVLAHVDRRLLASIELTMEGGRITELHADGDPTRLAVLSAALGPRGGG